MTSLQRDSNHVPVGGGVSDADNTTILPFRINSSNGRLKITATVAGGTGITSLNSDSTAAQTLTVGTTGTDFAIVDNGTGDHKFNLPSASATARGVITTGTQTIAGNKTFTGAITASNLSGTNTGDQNLFSSVPVSGQTTVTADTPTTALTLAAGSGMTITTDNVTKTVTFVSNSGGTGTVTTISVATANGFAGTVANPTTTPVITLTTTVTGILSGNGTAISAASTTGSGAVVLANTPTLITPVLGVATATSINKVTITAPATSATLTLANGSTLATSGANSITLTSTGATNVTLPTTGTLATLAGVETLSNKTLTAPKFANGGFIADNNGNEQVVFHTTASAVNQVGVTNAATGNPPLIASEGDDTNIGLRLHAKGSGKLQLGTANIQFPNADGSANEVLATDGAGVLSFVNAASLALNYGDGSDGNVTISAPTTLTRNMYYNNLTVNDVLTTGGFIIYVNGTLNGNGTIKFPDVNNGASSVDTTIHGAGGAAFTGGYFTNIAGGDGGNGSTSNQFGGPGVAGADGYIGSAGVGGGAGGKVNDGNNGGSGGGGGSNLASFTPTVLASLTLAGLEVSSSGSTVKYVVPGAGGGGGGNGIGTESSGGGGGGGGGGNGGVAVVIYGTKTWSGSYTLTGGTGGTAGTSATGAVVGGGGGGGGASGGVILIIARTWAGTFTISAPGGNGGNGSNGGGGANASSGVNGTSGTTGTSYEITAGSLTR